MIQEILLKSLWGNLIIGYVKAAALFLAGAVVIKVVELYILKRLKTWAQKTAMTFDDFILEIVKKTGFPLCYFGLFYFSINTLILGTNVKKIIDVIGVAVIIVFITRLAISFIKYAIDVYIGKRGKDISFKRSIEGIFRFVKVVIWGVAVVFFLDNLGFKISAFVAGLGICGMAIAFASQAILKDLLSYFAIIFDRPFIIGDFIIVGDLMGTVEHIGIVTTRINSLGGEQLIFSNTDLVNSRVRNYKKMQKRRVVFKLGVTYQTPYETLKEIPGIIAKVVKDCEDAIFDRAHFFSYGDFSLVFEVVYLVDSGDYNKYMDIQQEINFAIMKEFQERNIEFAYPTQTLYMNKVT